MNEKAQNLHLLGKKLQQVMVDPEYLYGAFCLCITTLLLMFSVFPLIISCNTRYTLLYIYWVYAHALNPVYSVSL